MNNFNENNLVKSLPDSYYKGSDGNNFKILELARVGIENVRKDLADIADILDINNAKGKTLDRYGERIGQVRGNATDEQYLVMLKAKILRNISNGSMPSLISALAFTLGCKKTDFKIVETENPCEIEIQDLPLALVNQAGFSASQMSAIIESLLPVGVFARKLEFDGTFEFSSKSDEYDAAAGFCDVEGGTLGGYLGYTASDKTEIILPI